jgi:LysM repeat protein
MRVEFRKNLNLFLLVLGLALLTCCSQLPLQVDNPPSITASRWAGTLLPYRTVTPTPTQFMTLPESELEFTPTPSATPFIHTVNKEETLLGIAIRYGVTLEALYSANPGVDPRLLSIGQELIIPVLQTTPVLPALKPTAVSLELASPRCYMQVGESLACLVEVTNEQTEPVESIQIWFGLYDTSGNLASSLVANSFLNLLQVNKQTALTVSFQPPFPENYIVVTKILTAIYVNSQERRYVPTSLQAQRIEILASKVQANISGQVSVVSAVRWVWVTALARDEMGEIVGVRKWKGAPDCKVLDIYGEAETSEPLETPSATIEPCGPFPFDLIVYSLGPEIVSVEVWSEAGP